MRTHHQQSSGRRHPARCRVESCSPHMLIGALLVRVEHRAIGTSGSGCLPPVCVHDDR
jgi:hypothetical protein